MGEGGGAWGEVVERWDRRGWRRVFMCGFSEAFLNQWGEFNQAAVIYTFEKNIGFLLALMQKCDGQCLGSTQAQILETFQIRRIN